MQQAGDLPGRIDCDADALCLHNESKVSAEELQRHRGLCRMDFVFVLSACALLEFIFLDINVVPASRSPELVERGLSVSALHPLLKILVTATEAGAKDFRVSLQAIFRAGIVVYK